MSANEFREGEVFARRWMRAVGVLYLLLGIRLLPFVNGPMIEAAGVDTVFTGTGLELGGEAFAYAVDWMGTFGVSLLPMGVVLLAASRTPARHRLLAWFVIGHEASAGVLADLWFVSRSYIPNAFYIGFIIVHLVVIATGLLSLRRLDDAGGRPVVSDQASPSGTV